MREAILVRLDSPMKQQLREHAARQGVSMSKVVEQLVKTHFEMADALDKETTPQEAHNLAIITGEHELPTIEE